MAEVSVEKTLKMKEGWRQPTLFHFQAEKLKLECPPSPRGILGLKNKPIQLSL